MHIEAFRDYCLAKKGTVETFPFDDETLVFKVAEKMFALTNVDDFTTVNLKCDPVRSEQLREMYGEVQPGYHMNKRHWNTITMGGAVPDSLLQELIDHSYDLVVRGLPKKVRHRLLS
jgi:predicted DNA-binding protein (MmcQ/YjbR family)